MLLALQESRALARLKTNYWEASEARPFPPAQLQCQPNRDRAVLLSFVMVGGGWRFNGLSASASPECPSSVQHSSASSVQLGSELCSTPSPSRFVRQALKGLASQSLPSIVPSTAIPAPHGPRYPQSMSRRQPAPPRSDSAAWCGVLHTPMRYKWPHPGGGGVLGCAHSLLSQHKAGWPCCCCSTSFGAERNEAAGESEGMDCQIAAGLVASYRG